METDTLVFQKMAHSKAQCGCTSLATRKNGRSLLALALGDSTKPCDWRAAQVSVESAGACFERFEWGSVEVCIAEAFAEATQAVKDLYGICAGADASLLLALTDAEGISCIGTMGQGIAYRYNKSGLVERLPLHESSPQLKLQQKILQAGEGVLLSNIELSALRGAFFEADVKGIFEARDWEDHLYTLMREVYLPQCPNEDLSLAILRCRAV